LKPIKIGEKMNTGTFSLSLAVSDIDKSLTFYSQMGFTVIDGGHTNPGFPDSETMKWRILENESVKLGLFQGMFEGNILTFNPSDVKSIFEKLKINGNTFVQELNGGNVCMLQDPDGNMLMFEQH